MKRKTRFVALALVAAMGISSITLPADTVKAEEAPQEYVVFAKNDAGYKKVEDYGKDMTEASQESEVLEENHVAVVELTESEAEILEAKKDIFIVEENILLTASEVQKNLKNNYALKKKEKINRKKKKYLEERKAANEVVKKEN
ncbi:MAG: hypothetical protein J6A92_04125 [Lachnospiraceae bacterium]|nr:hypothetical protein [Lachnospiraceae bacterium]